MALHGLPPTISVEHAAELLGVSRSAAYRAAKAGQLVTFRVGRRLLVPTALCCGCWADERKRL
jgi:excisionase family DNA binding protein